MRLRKKLFAPALIYDPAAQESYLLAVGEDPGVWRHRYLTWIDCWLGNIEQAQSWCDTVLTRARQLPNRFARSIMLGMEAHFHCWCGNTVEALQCSEEAVIASQDQGISQYAARSNTIHGWALAANGAVDQGLPEAFEGARASHNLKSKNGKWRQSLIVGDITGHLIFNPVFKPRFVTLIGQVITGGRSKPFNRLTIDRSIFQCLSPVSLPIPCR